MRTILTLIVFLLTASFQRDNSRHCPIVLKIAPGNILTVSQHISNKQYYLPITAMLTNTTRDTVKYYSMYCSWCEAYSTNIEGLYIASPGCDKNFPTIESIPPGQSVKRSFELTTNRDIYQEKSLQLKMVFYYVSGSNRKDFWYWPDFKSEGTPIWSNAITLTN